MPTSKIKSKTGNSYEVKFKVNGELSSLTSEQLQALALRYIRNAARAVVVATLNGAEPTILVNQRMAESMVSKLGIDPNLAAEFFASQTPPMYLEVPTTFELALTDLIPEEGSRGKKAADIFSFESEDEDENEEVADTTTPVVAS